MNDLVAHTTRNAIICAEWLQWLRDHGRSPSTVYGYGSMCEQLLTHLGTTPLDRVTLADLESWVSRPRRSTGKLGADATRHKEVVVLRGLWRWAIAHGKLLTNPTADLEAPRVRNEDPRAIDVDTWHSFYYSPMVQDVERVVYGLGFYCGLRRDEICHLETRHLNLEEGVIAHFPRKGDRNDKVTGKVPVVSCARLFAQEHPRLLGTARDFLEPLERLQQTRGRRKFLIPWGEESEAWHAEQERARPLPKGMTCPDQINNRLFTALRRSGLPLNAFTPHATRHSFVTYMLRAKVPLEVVSRLANHSSPTITMRYMKLAEDPIGHLLAEPLKGSRW